MVGSILLVASLSVTPPAPTVGDPVHIVLEDLGSRLVDVTPDPCFEVIDRTERSIRVRSFRPGPCTVGLTIVGPAEGEHVETAAFEVTSVLEEGETEPSPMRPPREIETPRVAWWSIGIAATAALLAWSFLLLRRERSASAATTSALAPIDELRAAAGAVGHRTGREQQVLLADAVRRYLDRTDPDLRADRTTGETLRVLSGRGDRLLEPVSLILRSGDRAKFSPSPVGDNPELLMAMKELLSHLHPPSDEETEQ